MSALATALVRQQIAGGTVDKRTERQRVKQEFQGAKGRYIEAVNEVARLLDRKAECLSIAQHDRANMEGIVSGWLRDGLVVGSNETERKGALAQLKEADFGYQNLAQNAAENEHLVKAEIEPSVVRLEYEIRQARYDMEMAITEGRMIAGEEDERHVR